MSRLFVERELLEKCKVGLLVCTGARTILNPQMVIHLSMRIRLRVVTEGKAVLCEGIKSAEGWHCLAFNNTRKPVLPVFRQFSELINYSSDLKFIGPCIILIVA